MENDSVGLGVEGDRFWFCSGNDSWLWLMINATKDSKKMSEASIAAKPLKGRRILAGEGLSSKGVYGGSEEVWEGLVSISFGGSFEGCKSKVK